MNKNWFKKMKQKGFVCKKKKKVFVVHTFSFRPNIKHKM